MDDVHQVAVQAQGDLAAMQVRAEPQPGAADAGVSVVADDAIDLDHGSGRQRDCGRQGRSARWRWAGGLSAAHPQFLQVVGGQVRRHGSDEFAVDEDVDAVLVGPDMRVLTAPGSAHLDALHARQDAEQAARRDDSVELDRRRRDG